MIYEMRVYEHAAGQAEAVRTRFEAEVAPRFPKHNIDLVAAFVEDETGHLVYLTRFPDEASRKAAWESFGSDPDWLAAKKASEVDGPLVEKQRKSVLSPAIAGLPIG